MLSLILPIYNQADNLKRNFPKLLAELNTLKKSEHQKYEILIVEESNDRTPLVASELQRKYSFVRHFHSETRLGKGAAISQGILKAKGDFVAFTDIDLAADISSLPLFVNKLKTYDVVVGARIAKRNKLRNFLGKGYATLSRFLFRVPVRDFQCGFKAFRRAAILPLLPKIRNQGFIWDTELLLKANKTGLRIAEVQVPWRERSPKLTLAHVRMPLELFRLWIWNV